MPTGPDSGLHADELVVQVFVDVSGRRGRWVRAGGYAVAAVCVIYVALVTLSLSGSQVGPLVPVPVLAGREAIGGLPPGGGSVGLIVARGQRRGVTAARARAAGSVTVPMGRVVAARLRDRLPLRLAPLAAGIVPGPGRGR